MKAPVKQLRKKDLIWLAENYCRHSHSYLDHYNCFLVEDPEDSPFFERVGFLDIETTRFEADAGYMLSYAIKELGGEVLGRILKPNEIRNFIFDKKIVEECCQDLKKFHRIIVYYGADYRFDIPFLRTRAIKYGYDFPLYKDVCVQDAYSVVKAKLRLQRNKLAIACDTLGVPSKGHGYNPETWMLAGVGHKESLEHIWKHNIEDVKSLEALWIKLKPYVLHSHRSI